MGNSEHRFRRVGYYSKVTAGPDGFQQHGSAPSFEEAQAAAEEQFRE